MSDDERVAGRLPASKQLVNKGYLKEKTNKFCIFLCSQSWWYESCSA